MSARCHSSPLCSSWTAVCSGDPGRRARVGRLEALPAALATPDAAAAGTAHAPPAAGGQVRGRAERCGGARVGRLQALAGERAAHGRHHGRHHRLPGPGRRQPVRARWLTVRPACWATARPARHPRPPTSCRLQAAGCAIVDMCWSLEHASTTTGGCLPSASGVKIPDAGAQGLNAMVHALLLGMCRAGLTWPPAAFPATGSRCTLRCKQARLPGAGRRASPARRTTPSRGCRQGSRTAWAASGITRPPPSRARRTTSCRTRHALWTGPAAADPSWTLCLSSMPSVRAARACTPARWAGAVAPRVDSTSLCCASLLPVARAGAACI